MSITAYGPQAATRADAARASMRTAAVNADRTATAADREAAATAEMGAYESFWHAHGVPAYAQPRARHHAIEAGWDAEDAQLRAENAAEDARFAALPDAEWDEEAERRGWSLAAQEPEAEMEAGA